MKNAKTLVSLCLFLALAGTAMTACDDSAKLSCADFRTEIAKLMNGQPSPKLRAAEGKYDFEFDCFRFQRLTNMQEDEQSHCNGDVTVATDKAINSILTREATARMEGELTRLRRISPDSFTGQRYCTYGTLYRNRLSAENCELLYLFAIDAEVQSTEEFMVWIYGADVANETLAANKDEITKIVNEYKTNCRRLLTEDLRVYPTQMRGYTPNEIASFITENNPNLSETDLTAVHTYAKEAYVRLAGRVLLGIRTDWYQYPVTTAWKVHLVRSYATEGGFTLATIGTTEEELVQLERRDSVVE